DEGIYLGWAVRGDRLGGSVRRDRDQHPGLVGSDALKKVDGLGFAHIRSPPYRFTTRWRIHLSTASTSLYSILLTTVALGKSSAGSRFHRQRVMPLMFKYLASVPLRTHLLVWPAPVDWMDMAVSLLSSLRARVN